MRDIRGGDTLAKQSSTSEFIGIPELAVKIALCLAKMAINLEKTITNIFG